MRFIIPVLALLATAFGNPTQVKRWACTPGTYSCTTDNKGWQVCNVSGDWVVSYLKTSSVGLVHIIISFVVCWHLPAKYRLRFLPG